MFLNAIQGPNNNLFDYSHCCCATAEAVKSGIGAKFFIHLFKGLNQTGLPQRKWWVLKIFVLMAIFAVILMVAMNNIRVTFGAIR